MSASDLVKHVVIIVKENHTFDNYFGRFPGVNGAQFPQAGDPTPDPPHDHRAWLKRNGPTGAVRLQYTQRDIPLYWAYARKYTLCDHYFTDVASQSEPNHLMLIAADSPIIDNASPHRAYQPQPPYDLPSLPAALVQEGMTGETMPTRMRHTFVISLTWLIIPQTFPRISSIEMWAMATCQRCAGCTPRRVRASILPETQGQGRWSDRGCSGRLTASAKSATARSGAVRSSSLRGMIGAGGTTTSIPRTTHRGLAVVRRITRARSFAMGPGCRVSS